jgi:parallel beta-helix repeat protein
LDDTTGTTGIFKSADNAGISNIEVLDITLRGIWDEDNSVGKQLAEFGGITGLYIHDCEFAYSRSFGIVVRHSDKVTVTNNIVHDVNGDGIAVWHTPNYIVSENTVYRCDDDCISAHCDDTDTAPVRSGGIISDNISYESQGIQVLGAKALSMQGNVMRRMKAYGFKLSVSAAFSQGNTPTHSIIVANNVVNDVFKREYNGTAEHVYMILNGAQRNAGTRP